MQSRTSEEIAEAVVEQFMRAVNGCQGELRAAPVERLRHEHRTLQGYAVRLKGVSSYKGQGREFLRILEQMQGVSGTTQKGFADGELVIELSCKCSASELQDRIFSAVQAVELLKSIDIENVSGKSLSFKL